MTPKLFMVPKTMNCVKNVAMQTSQPHPPSGCGTIFSGFSSMDLLQQGILARYFFSYPPSSTLLRIVLQRSTTRAPELGPSAARVLCPPVINLFVAVTSAGIGPLTISGGVFDWKTGSPNSYQVTRWRQMGHEFHVTNLHFFSLLCLLLICLFISSAFSSSGVSVRARYSRRTCASQAGGIFSVGEVISGPVSLSLLVSEFIRKKNRITWVVLWKWSTKLDPEVQKTVICSFHT